MDTDVQQVGAPDGLREPGPMTMPDSIWTLIISSLSIIIPFILPGLFMGINYLMKSLLGESNFANLGADISFSGFSIYFTSLIRQVDLNKIQASHELVAFILLLGFFLTSWIICLALCYRKVEKIRDEYQPIFASAFGVFSFYLCCVYTWKILNY